MRGLYKSSSYNNCSCVAILYLYLYIFPVPINTYITEKKLLEERYEGDYIDQIRIVATALNN